MGCRPQSFIHVTHNLLDICQNLLVRKAPHRPEVCFKCSRVNSGDTYFNLPFYHWCSDLDKNLCCQFSQSSTQMRMCTWDSHPLYDLHMNQRVEPSRIRLKLLSLLQCSAAVWTARPRTPLKFYQKANRKSVSYFSSALNNICTKSE